MLGSHQDLKITLYWISFVYIFHYPLIYFLFLLTCLLFVKKNCQRKRLFIFETLIYTVSVHFDLRS